VKFPAQPNREYFRRSREFRAETGNYSTTNKRKRPFLAHLFSRLTNAKWTFSKADKGRIGPSRLEEACQLPKAFSGIPCALAILALIQRTLLPRLMVRTPEYLAIANARPALVRHVERAAPPPAEPRPGRDRNAQRPRWALCWSKACCGTIPFSGHLFVFRGRRANLIKIVLLGPAPECASSPSGWSMVFSCGHQAASRAGR
jgi:hypothetical protein